MRRRRYWFLIAFFSVCVISYFSMWFLTRPSHGINERNGKRIKNGMRRAEVEALLRVPAGDYSTRDVFFFPLPAPPYRPWFYKNPATIWKSNEACVRIHFDDDDCVGAVFMDPIIELEASWWRKTRRWFGLE